MTHSELIRRGIEWLRTAQRCHFVLSETAGGNGEIPDAIGFKGTQSERGNVSIVIEAKVSRADFRTDRKKPFRGHDVQGMGLLRYYIVPDELVRDHELDALIDLPGALPGTRFKFGVSGWGLLWCGAAGVRIQRPSKRFDRNIMAELVLLHTALRRVQLRIHDPLHRFIEWDTAPCNTPKPTTPPALAKPTTE
jgi:hypothetical protein